MVNKNKVKYAEISKAVQQKDARIAKLEAELKKEKTERKQEVAFVDVTLRLKKGAKANSKLMAIVRPFQEGERELNYMTDEERLQVDELVDLSRAGLNAISRAMGTPCETCRVDESKKATATPKGKKKKAAEVVQLKPRELAHMKDVTPKKEVTVPA